MSATELALVRAITLGYPEDEAREFMDALGLVAVQS